MQAPRWVPAPKSAVLAVQYLAPPARVGPILSTRLVCHSRIPVPPFAIYVCDGRRCRVPCPVSWQREESDTAAPHAHRASPGAWRSHVVLGPWGSCVRQCVLFEADSPSPSPAVMGEEDSTQQLHDVTRVPGCQVPAIHLHCQAHAQVEGEGRQEGCQGALTPVTGILFLWCQGAGGLAACFKAVC